MPENNQNDWSARKCGAFWNRKSKDGQKKYLSGILELDGKKLNVVVFPNRNKKKDEQSNSPDLIMYKSDDEKPKASSPSVAPRKTAKAIEAETSADDIL